VSLGQRAGHAPVLADHHDRPGHRAREHERLVAGEVNAGQHARAVADDDRARRAIAPAVAPAEDGGTLAGGEQEPGDVLDDRRLAAPAGGQVPDADDGPVEPLRPDGRRAARPRPRPEGRVCFPQKRGNRGRVFSQKTRPRLPRFCGKQTRPP
jgi:hypothetical protein